MQVKVKYLKSAVHPVDFPDAKKPEIAIVGRSNVGKSTFINCLTGSSIAKVSQQPGKTRLLNFFDIGDYYRLVDTPGYGFAARSGDEVVGWRQMLETYFSTRGNFVGLLLLMDVRREWSKDETQLVEFMNSIGKPTLIVLTKTDKCKKNEVLEKRTALEKFIDTKNIWPVSSEKKMGVKELETYFFKLWVKDFKGVV